MELTWLMNSAGPEKRQREEKQDERSVEREGWDRWFDGGKRANLFERIHRGPSQR